ncbi:NusG domain II-containing protein [Vagococcus carniphilus]|uniref:NusG domain II-containing protein n=1 Tax=Vagococcus carniphilus TaxID=218144 RepID=UPI00289245E4|nr:NusG domain II-containing protein [Vagococcus carniphilus]MDT2814849.1 NusG domain II-containing protein [Vagococcus carniphilus]MDT2848935.1 NusG domain II-containing protein [Vagococcus carniphilus]
MIWKELKKQWRFMDGVVIICLIFLSFAPLVVFSLNQTDEATKEGNIAIISIDGKEVDRFELNEKTKHKEKTYYPGKDKYNIIEMEGTKIRVKEDNSPDQIAVRTSWISKPGQTSICLPHKLVIEIISNEPVDEEDDMIITY